MTRGRRLRVKICGVTDREGARTAAEYGADCVGFVFAESERRVTIAQAVDAAAVLPAGVKRVAVFRYPEPEEVVRVVEGFAPDVVQSESGPVADLVRTLGLDFLPVIHDAPSVQIDAAGARGKENGVVLLEGAGRGGRGVKADWERAHALALEGPLALAGGLKPENVVEAVRRVRPWGVDVSSGVERAPGRKDPDKVRQFIENARAAGRET